MPKVIASQLRGGNVVEIEGKLYTVLKAESIHPGKGTPVTQLSLRRISDGVKVDERYKTTDQVERVYIDERDFSYLFSGEDGHTFMDVENYEQIALSEDIIGDQAKWLQEGMVCQVKLYEGKPVAISIADKVTLEITETEPTVKGQTASSSYKPAVLSNGVRIMVPPHISAGVRVVVNTADDSYIERARD